MRGNHFVCSHTCLCPWSGNIHSVEYNEENASILLDSSLTVFSVGTKITYLSGGMPGLWMASLGPCFSAGLHWWIRDHWPFSLGPSMLARVWGMPCSTKNLLSWGSQLPIQFHCVGPTVWTCSKEVESTFWLYPRATFSKVVSCGPQYEVVMRIACSGLWKWKG